MKIGYARVSTDDQKMDLQRDALAAADCEKVFTDTASGAKAERPGLADALAFARKGDSLVVWRLDRLGRSLPELVNLVGELEAAGVGFESATERIETSTAAGRLVFHVFAALAEFERRLIVERTMAGLAAARARGRKGGRPGLPAEKVAAIQALAASGRGPAEVCKVLGIGRSTFYKHAYEPNEKTAKTLRDGKADLEVHHAKDAADLFAQLGIEETKGSAYAAIGMNDAEGMAAKAALADQIQDGISAGGLSKEAAAKQLRITLSKLSDLLRGQFRTISEADMRDYLGLLYLSPVAPTKGKRQQPNR
jgi:DNA invertase Pin-like site-specific DNA recombinase/predicted XRE-type DNA-binding protein